MTDSTCAQPGCDRAPRIKGLCNRHYKRRWAQDRAAQKRAHVPPREIEPNLLRERWLPAPGYEGSYEVSDHGRVRSLPCVVIRSNGHPITVGGRVLKIVASGNGRPVVGFPGGDRALVYRLVLEAFVGPCPLGMEACHDPDPDPMNCCLSNLRWDSHSANMLDRQRHGTDPYRNRTHCPIGHLLVEPNLVKSILAKGHRGCLACARARANVQTAKRQGLPFDFDELTDRHYKRIMASSVSLQA